MRLLKGRMMALGFVILSIFSTNPSAFGYMSAMGQETLMVTLASISPPIATLATIYQMNEGSEDGDSRHYRMMLVSEAAEFIAYNGQEPAGIYLRAAVSLIREQQGADSLTDVQLAKQLIQDLMID